MKFLRADFYAPNGEPFVFRSVLASTARENTPGSSRAKAPPSCTDFHLLSNSIVLPIQRVLLLSEIDVGADTDADVGATHAFERTKKLPQSNSFCDHFSAAIRFS